jgi:arylsulfatase
MALKEYKLGTAFPGVIERTIDRSQPAWPEPTRAKEGAPSVLFIVLDDTGFGQLGCFGSPIRTPNIDRLAANGLRFNNMHTTALCSPTRSCILTGRNHHSNAMACVTEGSTGFPGYNGNVPFENGFLSEILRLQAYNTYYVGKWHLTPAEQASAAGPYDRWPLGRGFDRFYGFLGGDTHQYYPDLVYDNHQVDPPRTPEEGYHLTVDLADHAIQFIADAMQVVPDKPFFLQFAPGATHAPHQVPKEWADRYKGQFDDGWDAYRQKVLERQKAMGLLPPDTRLSRHDPDVQEWDSLSTDEKRLYARMMEVFAGFLEHTDDQIGRLLGFLGRAGKLENTLLMLISDNGASAEGGPHGSLNEIRFFNNAPETVEQNLKAIDELGGPKYYNHYPWGWAWAGDTPFRRWKRETYLGGVADPFIVHWPKGLRAKGEVRSQYAHAIDMVPTVLDCLGIEPPDRIRGVTQSPIEGVSFAHALDDARAESRHRTQYFEMFGHRSLHHDGWRAICPVPGPSFKEAGKRFGEVVVTEQKLRELDRDGWELYHVAEDPAETRNLAQQERGRLIEMIALWYVAAGKYNVLPLDSRGVQRFVDERPQLARPTKRCVYYPHTAGVPERTAPNLHNRPHSITAEVEIQDGAEGVLLAQGGTVGGYSLFVKDRKLHYIHNYLEEQQFHVESASTLPQGKHELRFEFEPTGWPDVAQGKGSPGKAQLYVDRSLVGEAEIPVTVPLLYGISDGLSCGRDDRSPVTDLYQGTFEFQGRLEQVVVEVEGELIEDEEAHTRMVMARD